MLTAFPRSGRLTRQEALAVLAVAACGVLVLLVVVLLRLVAHVAPDQLMLDPAVVAGYPDRVGSVSNLGVLAWTTAAVAGLLAGSVPPRSGTSRLLVGLGGVSAVLALDDLFRGHEQTGALLGGEAENLALAALGLLAVAVLRRHRQVVLGHTPVVVLAAASVLFAVSLLTDAVLDRPGIGLSGRLFVEEGAKLMGILLWTSYVVLVGYRHLTARQPTRQPTASAVVAQPPARPGALHHRAQVVGGGEAET